MREVIFAMNRWGVYRDFDSFDFDGMLDSFGRGETSLGIYSEFGGTLYCSKIRDFMYLLDSYQGTRVITHEEGTFRMYSKADGCEGFIVWTVFAYDSSFDIKDGVKDKVDFSFDRGNGFNIDSGMRIVEIAPDIV